MPILDDGGVEITLAGDKRRLVPTLEAAQHISRACGGLLAASDRLAAYDVDAFLAVTAAGLSASPREMQAIAPAVFAELIPLQSSLQIFVGVLLNGGKPPKPAGEDGEPGGP